MKKKDYAGLKSVIASKVHNAIGLPSSGGSTQRLPSFGAPGLNFTLNRNNSKGCNKAGNTLSTN